MPALTELIADCPNCKTRINVPMYKAIERSCDHVKTTPDAIHFIVNPETRTMFTVCAICEAVI